MSSDSDSVSKIIRCESKADRCTFDSTCRCGSCPQGWHSASACVAVCDASGLICGRKGYVIYPETERAFCYEHGLTHWQRNPFLDLDVYLAQQRRPSLATVRSQLGEHLGSSPIFVCHVLWTLCLYPGLSAGWMVKHTYMLLEWAAGVKRRCEVSVKEDRAYLLSENEEVRTTESFDVMVLTAATLIRGIESESRRHANTSECPVNPTRRMSPDEKLYSRDFVSPLLMLYEGRVQCSGVTDLVILLLGLFGWGDHVGQCVKPQHVFLVLTAPLDGEREPLHVSLEGTAFQTLHHYQTNYEFYRRYLPLYSHRLSGRERTDPVDAETFGFDTRCWIKPAQLLSAVFTNYELNALTTYGLNTTTSADTRDRLVFYGCLLADFFASLFPNSQALNTRGLSHSFTSFPELHPFVMINWQHMNTSTDVELRRSFQWYDLLVWPSQKLGLYLSQPDLSGLKVLPTKMPLAWQFRFAESMKVFNTTTQSWELRGKNHPDVIKFRQGQALVLNTDDNAQRYGVWTLLPSGDALVIMNEMRQVQDDRRNMRHPVQVSKRFPQPNERGLAFLRRHFVYVSATLPSHAP